MKIPSLRVMERVAHLKVLSGRHKAPMNLDEYRECQCMNCNTTFKGNYCPNCGQSSSTGRLTMMHAVDNLLGLYLNLDSGLLHTCVDLLYRPGYMMRDYIKGHRVEYVKPIQLLFIFATIYLILHYVLFFGTEDKASEDKALGQQEKIEVAELKEHLKVKNLEAKVEMLADEKVADKEEVAETEKEDDKHRKQIEIPKFLRDTYDTIMGLLDNQAVRALLLVTLMVFPYKICFRKTPVGQTINYVECFYMMVYIQCQQLMFSIAILPIERVLYHSDGTVSLGLLILWDTKQFFDITWRRSIKLNILSFVVGILLLILIGVVIGVTTTMIWGL